MLQNNIYSSITFISDKKKKEVQSVIKMGMEQFWDEKGMYQKAEREGQRKSEREQCMPWI